MPTPSSHEHARHQSAMWRRLGEQCRLCGEYALENEAMALALHYERRAEEGGNNPMHLQAATHAPCRNPENGTPSPDEPALRE